MLTSQLRRDGPGPARKVYEITEAGRGVLQTAVADLLRQPRALGSGFELGLINMKALKPKQVFTVLRHHQQDLQERYEAIEKTWARYQQNEPTPDHIRAMYTHSLALMQAELAWLTNFLEDWRQRYPFKTTDEMRQAEVDPQATHIHQSTEVNDPAKMLQRIKRPPRTDVE
jgi:DNA-binding PadR family transcriptional regulator